MVFVYEKLLPEGRARNDFGREQVSFHNHSRLEKPLPPLRLLHGEACFKRKSDSGAALYEIKEKFNVIEIK